MAFGGFEPEMAAMRTFSSVQCHMLPGMPPLALLCSALAVSSLGAVGAFSINRCFDDDVSLRKVSHCVALQPTDR